MYKLEVSDLVFDDNRNKAKIIFEDENGDVYAFSLTPEKARVIYLAMYQIYVPKNTVYEVFLSLIDSFSLNIKSVIIEDVENLNAYLILETQDFKEIKIPICVQDAFVVGILSKAQFYIKKDTCFIDHVEYCWLDFVKRFLGV